MKKLLNVLFVALVVIFVSIGFILVFGQFLSVVLLNGALSTTLKTALFKKGCMIAASACMIAFVLSYFERNKK